MAINPKHILISRTDSIGDVVLTLPICGLIKTHFPNCRLTFVGRKYTEEVIRSCSHIDGFLNWDSANTAKEQERLLTQANADTILHAFPDREVVIAAHKSNIKNRIATGNRLHTFLHCNKKVWFSRKKSDLHESQLNIKLLEPLGIETDIPLIKIPVLYGFTNIESLSNVGKKLLNSDKTTIVLHTKSKGSAVEWPLDRFNELIALLPKEKYQIILSGTEEEGKLIRDRIEWSSNVIDATGKMSLAEFISFLKNVDLVVAGSTGPLHIASALGTPVIGLYSPARPIHPGRWMPVGINAHYLVNKESILKGTLDISAQSVYSKIEEVLTEKSS